jgi:hypothetical protein
VPNVEVAGFRRPSIGLASLPRSFLFPTPLFFSVKWRVSRSKCFHTALFRPHGPGMIGKTLHTKEFVLNTVSTASGGRCTLAAQSVTENDLLHIL